MGYIWDEEKTRQENGQQHFGAFATADASEKMVDTIPHSVPT
jgi:hypothetical protein